MLNMIKMDLFRMFRARSLYIICAVFLALIVMTTFFTKEDLEYAQEEAAVQSEVQEENVVELGMSVRVLPDSDGKVSLLGDFSANIAAKVIALFLVIFTVLFSSADFTSGYIKNISGQVKNRGMLILSKAVCLFVCTAAFMMFSLVVQGISERIIIGYFRFGDLKELLVYAALQIMLHFALLLIVMCITIVSRSNLISMILGICLCMNFMMIAYSAIDKLISKIGIKDFSTINYTVTGRMTLLSTGCSAKQGITTLVIAIVFGAVFTIAASVFFRKRDVV